MPNARCSGQRSFLSERRFEQFAIMDRQAAGERLFDGRHGGSGVSELGPIAYDPMP